MPCGSPKKSPCTSSIVQIIFSFWSFEISEGILRDHKIIISLDSFYHLSSTENRVEGESHDKPAKHKKPGKTSEDATQKERKEDGRGRKKRKKKKRVKEKDDGIYIIVCFSKILIGNEKVGLMLYVSLLYLQSVCP